MKPERAFIAERTLANHCPELLRPAPSDGGDALAEGLSLLGERLAKSFAVGLAQLSGGDDPDVRCEMPGECGMAELDSQIAPLAVNSLFGLGSGAAPLLISIGGETILRLVDRTFGGQGNLPDPLPDTLPLSAELFTVRLETVLAAAMVTALDVDSPPALTLLRRKASLAQLAPFPAKTDLIRLDLIVEEDDREAWRLILAMPADTAALLVMQTGDTAHGGSAARGPANPAATPFGDMPITLHAVLVDMGIGCSRLSALQPGDILPVSVARTIPLKIGETTIAQGTIGEFDDRVAVQINHAF